MNPNISPDDLRGFALLEGFSDAALTELISHCETTVCPPETIVLEQGDNDRALVFVLDGSVEVRIAVPHVGNEVVATLPAGSVFGEVSFFHAAPHSATVACVESARLMRLERSKFDELKAADSLLALALAANAAELLGERLQQIDDWLAQRLTEIQDRRLHESWRRFREHVGRPTYVSGGFKV
jgi:CRP-like cAMP-binding protein